MSSVYRPSKPAPDYDAVLLVSFGGPEGPDDVMPFLEEVTRGKNVPRQRLAEVAEHYYLFGGVSPLNSQNRKLLAALSAELQEHGPRLSVYWGNRCWRPSLVDAVHRMTDDGVRHALAFVTSAFGSYLGCRQYVEQIEQARLAVGPRSPQIDKLRLFFNHPGFIEATADRISTALAAAMTDGRPTVRLLFTAHSLPVAAAGCSPYVRQLQESCRLVVDFLEQMQRTSESDERQPVGSTIERYDWDIVFQSRSGPPSQPWLTPDIRDHIRLLRAEGDRSLLAIVPIGFISENMEVIYDLDIAVRALCDELGTDMIRVPVVGDHPRFVRMIRELIAERLDPAVARQSLGPLGPWPNECPAGCCIQDRRQAT